MAAFSKSAQESTGGELLLGNIKNLPETLIPVSPGGLHIFFLKTIELL